MKVFNIIIFYFVLWTWKWILNNIFGLRKRKTKLNRSHSITSASTSHRRIDDRRRDSLTHSLTHNYQIWRVGWGWWWWCLVDGISIEHLVRTHRASHIPINRVCCDAHSNCSHSHTGERWGDAWSQQNPQHRYRFLVLCARARAVELLGAKLTTEQQAAYIQTRHKVHF